MSEKPILIAGIGNIFLGDDAFGVEVVQRLARRPLPPEVEVVDFGIRGLDLSYALLDDYRAAILVDTTYQGGRPGTLYVIEPEPEASDDPSFQHWPISPHQMDPTSTLHLVQTMGGSCRRIVLVACEPSSFRPWEEGRMGLSDPVLAAVDEAVGLIESMVKQMQQKEMQYEVGLAVTIDCDAKEVSYERVDPVLDRLSAVDRVRGSGQLAGHQALHQDSLDVRAPRDPDDWSARPEPRSQETP